MREWVVAGATRDDVEQHIHAAQPWRLNLTVTTKG
jgi:hypothetical protein